jgi:hypothetical protein
MSHFLPACPKPRKNKGLSDLRPARNGTLAGELSGMELGQKWDMGNWITPRSYLGAIRQSAESGPKLARNTEILV